MGRCIHGRLFPLRRGSPPPSMFVIFSRMPALLLLLSPPLISDPPRAVATVEADAGRRSGLAA